MAVREEEDRAGREAVTTHTTLPTLTQQLEGAERPPDVSAAQSGGALLEEG